MRPSENGVGTGLGLSGLSQRKINRRNSFQLNYLQKTDKDFSEYCFRLANCFSSASSSSEQRRVLPSSRSEEVVMMEQIDVPYCNRK